MRPPSAHRRRAAARAAAVFALAGALLLAVAVPAAGQNPRTVLVTELRGAVTPVIADHLVDAVGEAEQGGYHALVVEMDTPGGLDSSMRDIVKAFLSARVPVIVYVAPSGARAASAGAIITLSAHVAAMAPGTNIGAATPIALEGGEVNDKVVNDAVAYARTIAEERARNVDFAEDMVRAGASAPAGQAVELGVVDLLARDRTELLDEVDGWQVGLADGSAVTLQTSGAVVDELELTWVRRILQRVADPNLAFLFISLGTLAILYELANPGAGVGGIAGVIMLILAFYALSVLPTNLAGVALLVLAILLLVAELFVPGVGVLAGGGAVALLLAGLLLFQRPSGIGVDATVLWPTVGVTAAGAIGVAIMASRLRRRPPLTGGRTLVGKTVEVRRADGQRGQVFLDGAWWGVRSAGGPLAEGTTVRVIDQDGLTLVVQSE